MPRPLPPIVRTYLGALMGDHPVDHLQLAVSEDVICEFFAGDRSTTVKGRSALAEIIKQRRASFKELNISAVAARSHRDWLHVTFCAAGITLPRAANFSSEHGFAFVYDVTARYRIQTCRISNIVEHWISRHSRRRQ